LDAFLSFLIGKEKIMRELFVCFQKPRFGFETPKGWDVSAVCSNMFWTQLRRRKMLREAPESTRNESLL
jgi:hypothetical protein